VPDLYSFVRSLLQALPPETAHRMTLMGLSAGFGATPRAADPLELRQRVWGLDFANPVGIAAGFDKDAQVLEALLRLGFGFVEVGTVTPQPQAGNPKPRVFRLEPDGALINRMGFNSGGLDRVIERLRRRNREMGIVGVNVGRNRDSADASTDYEEGVRRSAPLADYLVVNVSSPNTPGLRDLQARGMLEALLCRVLAARERSGAQPPLLLKIAPDLSTSERADIAAVALATGIDGIVVSNTTIARPPGLRSPDAKESGGLSGRPLFEPSTGLLAEMYGLTDGKLPLIGVGGITSAADAYTKIRAGASLVQLYTALVFAGPALLSEIKAGLAALLRRDGFASIAEVVGVDHAKVAEISLRRSGAS
jgi:dihydroorotate dehydrogenase